MLNYFDGFSKWPPDWRRFRPHFYSLNVAVAAQIELLGIVGAGR
jgi:hypothetical protein